MSGEAVSGEVMSEEVMVDEDALREQVREKYREVATDPGREYHFHTGRPLAARLGYDAAVVDNLPDCSSIRRQPAHGRPPAIQAVHRSMFRIADSGIGLLLAISANCSRPPGRSTRKISEKT